MVTGRAEEGGRRAVRDISDVVKTVRGSGEAREEGFVGCKWLS